MTVAVKQVTRGLPARHIMAGIVAFAAILAMVLLSVFGPVNTARADELPADPAPPAVEVAVEETPVAPVPAPQLAEPEPEPEVQAPAPVEPPLEEAPKADVPDASAPVTNEDPTVTPDLTVTPDPVAAPAIIEKGETPEITAPAVVEEQPEVTITSVSANTDTPRSLSLQVSYEPNTDPATWINPGSSPLFITIGQSGKTIFEDTVAVSSAGSYGITLGMDPGEYSLQIQGFFVDDCGDCAPIGVQYQGSFTVKEIPVVDPIIATRPVPNKDGSKVTIPVIEGVEYFDIATDKPLTGEVAVPTAPGITIGARPTGERPVVGGPWPFIYSPPVLPPETGPDPEPEPETPAPQPNPNPKPEVITPVVNPGPKDQVKAPSSKSPKSSDELAATGANGDQSLWLALAALGTIVAGGGMKVLRRRRA